MKFSIFLLTFLTVLSYGQHNNIYYKNIQFDKIYSEEQYNSFKSKLSENLRHDNITFEEIFLDEIVTNDSIIKSFVIEIISPEDEVAIDDYQLIKDRIVGNKFSELEFETLSENSTTFKQFEGKPTLVNLWFTQCKPCIEEMPVLNKIKSIFNDKINFVSLTFSTEKEVLSFLKKNEFNFFHLVNAGSFIKEIGVVSFPINILIDRNGIVKAVEPGIPFTGEGEDIKITDGQSLIISLAKLLKK